MTALYFLLPHKFRWALLLVASIIFYIDFIPSYIFILAFLILVDYVAAIFIERAQGMRRKIFLIVSIVANVGLLATFKYYNFFVENLTILAGIIHWNYSLPTLALILPLGLSFHTFQAMSYTIEVYRGKVKSERHLGIYALYVLFYPRLAAGPIERPQTLLSQFYEKHEIDWARIGSGLRLMLFGFFKKIVIADNIALIVDRVYNYPTQFQGASLIFASVLFTFQLYADFSGYSDIAIGSAKVMGFNLTKNFNRPFASKSISEFWQRWHISLSSWFRDYLYFPLGGSRVSAVRWLFNIMIVFMISGLWHGAQWTFIIWGALHGFYIVSEKFLKKLVGRIWNFLQIPATFGFTVFAFIFFRANSLKDALYIISHSFTGLSWNISMEQFARSLGVAPFTIFQIAIALIFMEIIQFIDRDGVVLDTVSKRPFWIRWTVYNALILAIIFFGYFGERQFIYFQF